MVQGRVGAATLIPMAGPYQLLIVLVLILVLFGGTKLPQLARSIGQAQKEFQQGLKEGAPDDAADSEKKDS